MKINEAIQLQENMLIEGQFSKPVLAYHGTSFENLNTILSQGLITSKSGSGWGSGFGGNPRQRIMDPFEGVYLTQRLGVAMDAAETAGSRRNLIVIVQYQPRSAVIDEDTIDMYIDLAMSMLIDASIKRNVRSAYDLVNDHPREAVKLFLDNLSGQVAYLLKQNTQANIVVYHLIKTYLERMLTYKIYHNDMYYELREQVPTPSVAEQNYRTYLEKMTVMLKRLTYDPEHNTGRPESFRSRESIGYSGVNKIIGIFSYGRTEHIYIHYGQIPHSTKVHLEQLLQAPSLIYDKQ